MYDIFNSRNDKFVAIACLAALVVVWIRTINSDDRTAGNQSLPSPPTMHFKTATDSDTSSENRSNCGATRRACSSFEMRTTNSGVETTQSCAPASDPEAGPAGISIHACLVRFTVSSPQAETVLKDFETRLETVLADFNAHSTSHSDDFLTSDEFAALIKNFQSAGDCLIQDEAPRRISEGKTAEWGTVMTLSATPTIEPQESASVSMSAAFGASRLRATVALRSGKTIVLGGSTTCAIETHLFHVPLLEQIPIIGPQLFAFPVTTTKGIYERILLNATILP